MFDRIWEQADLTVWRPEFSGKRNSGLVAHLVMEQLERFAYNRRGQTMRDISQVVLHERQGAFLDTLWEHSHADHFRPFLLTTLNRTVPNLTPKPGWRSVLLPAPALKMSSKPVSIDFGFYQRLVNQFTVGRDVNCRRLALLQLEPCQNRAGTFRFFKVCDAAFRAVSDEYIPVDSGHELELTKVLVSEGRHFRKPLLLSPFKYLPDFILYDSPTVTLPMEVFGMNHAEYQAHREEKSGYYDDLLGRDGWWSWSPLESATIPPLPDRRR